MLERPKIYRTSHPLRVPVAVAFFASKFVIVRIHPKAGWSPSVSCYVGIPSTLSRRNYLTSFAPRFTDGRGWPFHQSTCVSSNPLCV